MFSIDNRSVMIEIFKVGYYILFFSNYYLPWYFFSNFRSDSMYIFFLECFVKVFRNFNFIFNEQSSDQTFKLRFNTTAKIFFTSYLKISVISEIDNRGWTL